MRDRVMSGQGFQSFVCYKDFSPFLFPSPPSSLPSSISSSFCPSSSFLSFFLPFLKFFPFISWSLELYFVLTRTLTLANWLAPLKKKKKIDYFTNLSKNFPFNPQIFIILPSKISIVPHSGLTLMLGRAAKSYLTITLHLIKVDPRHIAPIVFSWLLDNI